MAGAARYELQLFDADSDIPALYAAACQLAEDIDQQFDSSEPALPPHRHGG